MSIRTDLAVECLDFVGAAEAADGGLPQGVTQEIENVGGRTLTRVVVTDERAIGKPRGEYITIETANLKDAGYDFNKEVTILAAVISKLLGNSKRVLVVGLGNSDITPDALGPKAINYIFVTAHIDENTQKEIGLEGLNPVYAIAPSVLGKTGIESAEIICAVTKNIMPDMVLVIDALAAKSLDRLTSTVQLSTAGITPGSGVQNSRLPLNNETLGVPVISIGVPMVVDMDTIAQDLYGAQQDAEGGRQMFVTPREIDVAVEHAAKTVAFAINKALQPQLDLETLTALVG